MKSVPILKSKRCILREIRNDDFIAIQELMNDDEFQRFLPELYELTNTEDGICQFLKSFSVYLEQDEGILWGISLNSNIVGFVAIMDMTDNPTLFYTIHSLHRNNGYMTECISSIISFLMKHKFCDYIQTEVYDENVASLNVLFKNGFEIIGHYNAEKTFLKLNIKK